MFSINTWPLHQTTSILGACALVGVDPVKEVKRQYTIIIQTKLIKLIMTMKKKQKSNLLVTPIGVGSCATFTTVLNLLVQPVKALIRPKVSLASLDMANHKIHLAVSGVDTRSSLPVPSTLAAVVAAKRSVARCASGSSDFGLFDKGEACLVACRSGIASEGEERDEVGEMHVGRSGRVLFSFEGVELIKIRVIVL